MIAIAKGEVPEIPEGHMKWSQQYRELWTICNDCWRLDPTQRPRMSENERRIGNLLQEDRWVLAPIIRIYKAPLTLHIGLQSSRTLFRIRRKTIAT